jgi:hypothetical protein
MIKLKTLLEVQLIKEALPLSAAREFVSIQRNPKIKVQMNVIMDFLKRQPNSIVSKNGSRIAIPMTLDSNNPADVSFESNAGWEFLRKIHAYTRMANDNILGDNFEFADPENVVLGKFEDLYGRYVKPSKYIHMVVAAAEGKSKPNETDEAKKNRINKIVQQLINEYDSIEEVQNARSNKVKEHYIVFSTHAYDIAGMSTGRGWSSCMNLYTDASHAKHYVHQDIEHGTIIAYLVSPQDLNIENPTARILIKPYINADDPNDVLYDPDPEYGTAPKKFYKFVASLIDQAQPGKSGQFTLVSALYCDDALRDRSNTIEK